MLLSAVALGLWRAHRRRVVARRCRAWCAETKTGCSCCRPEVEALREDGHALRKAVKRLCARLRQLEAELEAKRALREVRVAKLERGQCAEAKGGSLCTEAKCGLRQRRRSRTLREKAHGVNGSKQRWERTPSERRLLNMRPNMEVTDDEGEQPGSPICSPSAGSALCSPLAVERAFPVGSCAGGTSDCHKLKKRRTAPLSLASAPWEGAAAYGGRSESRTLACDEERLTMAAVCEELVGVVRRM